MGAPPPTHPLYLAPISDFGHHSPFSFVRFSTNLKSEVAAFLYLAPIDLDKVSWQFNEFFTKRQNT